MQHANKRSGNRDSGRGRRSSPDRRQSQQSIGFPDRREGDRRQLSDRRRTREEVIPVLEWRAEPEDSGGNKERRKRILLVGILAALLPAALVGIYFADPADPPPVVRRRPDPPKTSGKLMLKRAKKPKGKQKPADRSGTVSTLSQDILNIAPHIYSGVRLELESGEYADKDSDSHKNLKSVFVRIIEIFARAKAWDKLESSEKVDLLHRTFDLLKSRYPYITRFVKLIFDDGRKDLELKFGEVYTGKG